MANQSNYYAVIMAGGVGSRFWPMSRSSFPKQFHDILGTGKSLLQSTFHRLNSFIPAENILILTNAQYAKLVLDQLPEITEDQVVLEPVMRNTAPCLLLAALKINKMNEKGVMLVAPSDHWITKNKAFSKDIVHCFEKCLEQDILCTLGIKPTYPNTGFGYIEFERNSGNNGAKRDLRSVVRFREKPDQKTAEGYIEQGNFLWNAGIFVWSVASLLKAFKSYQPGQYELFNSGFKALNTTGEAKFLTDNYHKAENISIDYAIMENADNIKVLPASFGWSDLGTWRSLYDKLEKDPQENVMINGHLIAENATGNVLRMPKGKIVVVEGLEDYIIVDEGDVLLIMPKAKEQEIKTVVARIREEVGDEYV